MGNQPSVPSPPQSSPPSPPIPPPCDMDCQRQKQLDGLKIALDTATDNKDIDPGGYEQARIAYYTLLNGQGWLAGEKDRIAKQEIEPILTEYSTQFKTLKDKKKQQSIFVNLSSALSAQEKEDESEVKFLNSEVAKEINNADILNRLTQLKTVSEPQQDWLHYLLYALVGLLAIYTVYLVITKAIKYVYPPQFGGKKSKT